MILVVDPVADNRRACSAALESTGWPVVEAASLAEAMDELPGAQLALIDPAVRGLREELGAAASSRGIPVLGVSAALGGKWNRALAIRVDGFADLIELPLEGDVLVQWVERLLGEAPRPAMPDVHAEATLPDDEADEPLEDPGATRVGDVQSLMRAMESSRQEQPTPSAVQALATAEHTSAPDVAAAAPRRLDAPTPSVPERSSEPARPAAEAPPRRRQGETPPSAGRMLLVPRVLDPHAVQSQGTFDESVWPAVLGWLAAEPRTGFILLAQGRERLVIGLDHSRPVSADSNALPFERWIERSGLVDEAGARAIAEVEASTGRPARELLDYGRRGLQLDLADLEAAWLRALLHRPFDWADGKYAWREESVAIPSPCPSRVELTDVLWEGVIHGTDPEHADGLIRAFARQPIGLQPGVDGVPGTWWLNNAQRRLLERLALGGTVERSAEERRDGSVTRLVYGLLTAGLAGFAP